MYIPPLLLVVPEFAIDFCEERKQLFDTICLKEDEELNSLIIDEISDYGYDLGCGYGNGDSASVCGYGSGRCDFHEYGSSFCGGYGRMTTSHGKIRTGYGDGRACGSYKNGC